MLPLSLRVPSERTIADMESERAMFGLTIKDLSDLYGPFSRSSYWRWLQGEARAVVAVEVGLARVREACQRATDDVLRQLGPPDPRRTVHILRWRDEKGRTETIGDAAVTRLMPFTAYASFIGRLVSDVRAAGHRVEVSFHEEGPASGDAEAREVIAPDPELPVIEAPASAERRQRRRHYG